MSQNTTVTMDHFVKLYSQPEDANSANGIIQLAQSGELYITKPRSGTKALISNLWASFNVLFFNRDFVLKDKQIENKNRQQAAVKKFAELLDVAELDENLTFQLIDKNIPFGSPAFFKEYIEKNKEHPALVRVENQIRADAEKLIPEECSRCMSLPLPDSDYKNINCQNLSPEQRVILAEIYNILLDLRVVQATKNDENISKFNDVEIDFLQQLGSDPIFLNTAKDCITHTRHSISLMLNTKKKTYMASFKVAFCCWNTFWKNKLNLEYRNEAMSDLLLQCASQYGISYALQRSSKDNAFKDSLYLCHSPSITPITKATDKQFQQAKRLYSKPDDNTKPRYTSFNDQAWSRLWNQFDDLVISPDIGFSIHDRLSRSINRMREDPHFRSRYARVRSVAEHSCEESGVSEISKLFKAQEWDSFTRLCELNIPKTKHLDKQVAAADPTKKQYNPESAAFEYWEGLDLYKNKLQSAEYEYYDGVFRFLDMHDSLNFNFTHIDIAAPGPPQPAPALTRGGSGS